MRNIAILPLVLAQSSVALGQAVDYSLGPGSGIVREFCLPPCLCPPLQQAGALHGDFSLSFLDSNPFVTRYTVSVLAWTADIPEAPTAMSGSGIYTIGGEFAMVQRLELDLTIGPLTVINHFDSGFVPMDPAHPFPEIRITTTTGVVGCRRDTITLAAAPGGGCYPNCDGSTSPPVLNVADFACFVQRFGAGEMYANCDGSILPPVLNAADFTCFLQRFAAGCP